jgi:hypothetical protein
MRKALIMTAALAALVKSYHVATVMGGVIKKRV